MYAPEPDTSETTLSCLGETEEERLSEMSEEEEEERLTGMSTHSTVEILPSVEEPCVPLEELQEVEIDLKLNFSVIYHGLGSKVRRLHEIACHFQQSQSPGHIVVEYRVFENPVSETKLLNEIYNIVTGRDEPTKTMSLKIKEILQELSPELHLLLVIHSIDMLPTKDDLVSLCHSKRVHLVASINYKENVGRFDNYEYSLLNLIFREDTSMNEFLDAEIPQNVKDFFTKGPL